MRTRGRGERSEEGGLAVGCRGCSRIDYLPALHRIGVCSRPVLPSLFARRIPTRPTLLYLSLRTYSVFPSPRPIYLPPRVAEWILFVSHRYFSGPACRSPSKTVSPPRFMFPPTQRRIDPFLLSDVYVCGGASSALPVPASPLPLPARASTDLPHTTGCTRSSRSRRPPKSPCFAFFRDFFSAVLSPSPASVRSFLPLTALYRLVTSVSRARDLRASAPGRTIEHYDFSRRPEAFTSTTVMDK